MPYRTGRRGLNSLDAEGAEGMERSAEDGHGMPREAHLMADGN